MKTIIIAIVGTLAILVFLVHGFVVGRRNRKPIARDMVAEDNAKDLSPTADIENIENDSVQIINMNLDNTVDTGFINSDINGAEGTVDLTETINIEKEANASQSLNIKNEQEEKTGMNLFDKIKSFFYKKNEEEKYEEVEQPLQCYQINIMCRDGSSIKASRAVEICEKYHLVMGENDIYYHIDELGRDVFRVCGGNAPYNFSPNNSPDTSFTALCLLMLLPERGQAEDSYLKMAQFSFILAQEINGVMVDKSSREVGKEVILHNREVLQKYDELG